MSQLALTKSAKSTKADFCACGHAVEHHDVKGRCTYGKDTFHGGCTCTRRKPRGRLVVVQPPELAAPAASVLLMRPDTKRPKAMGWTLVAKNNAIVYLEQLKTKSPNEGKGGNTPKFFAMRAAYIAGCRGRARAGVAQAIAKHALYDLVEKIIITRVSSGTLDDDNLGGALKPIRDGIADALAVNDADFSLEGRDEAKLALHYRQAKPGRRKCCGVRIELFAGVS